jgi:hypothetical protein
VKRPLDKNPSTSGLLASPIIFGLERAEIDKFFLHDQIALRTIAAAKRRSDGSPIRDIATGRRNRPVGEYVSYKARIRLPHESSHEMLNHYLNEVDPEIFYMLAQPHTLRFRWKGRDHRYTPDVELWTERGHIVREVKEAATLRQDRDLIATLDLVGEIYQRAGFRFQVLTDKEIRTEPRLQNATLVQKYRRLQLAQETELRLLDHLDTAGGVSTLEECARALKASAGGREFVMAMMCRRFVKIDFSRPIAGISPVFRHFAREPAQPSIALRREAHNSSSI